MSQAWRDIARRKKEEQATKIPKEWLLTSQPSPNLNSVIDVPRRCGLLTEKELNITEHHDATALVEKLAKRALSSEEVVTAFCKRAAIAHQLVHT